MNTIGSLLFVSGQPQRLSRMLDDAGVSAELQGHASGDALAEMHSQLTDILHINPVDLLLDFFKTGYKLRETAKKSMRTGVEGLPLDLQSFEVAWRYEPVLKVYVDSVRLCTVNCLVQVAFTISACTVVVEQGYITTLKVGPTTAAAKLEVRKIRVLGSRDIPIFDGGPVLLPGRGIPLTHHEGSGYPPRYGY